MEKTNRAKRVIERAEKLKPIFAFAPPDWEYCKVVPCNPRICSGRWTYRTKPEPIVKVVDLYKLPYQPPHEWTSIVTVNAYGAAVLNSKNLLFADIDFGDRHFDEHAGAEDVDEVESRLRDLGKLDEDLFCFCPPGGFRFAEQHWRIYSTAAGARVVLVSTPAVSGLAPDGYLVKRLFRFLGVDPCYAKLCEEQKSFRARLTSKPWRNESQVCFAFPDVGPGGVHPDLAEQLALHDELTLSNGG